MTKSIGKDDEFPLRSLAMISSYALVRMRTLSTTSASLADPGKNLLLWEIQTLHWYLICWVRLTISSWKRSKISSCSLYFLLKPRPSFNLTLTLTLSTSQWRCHKRSQKSVALFLATWTRFSRSSLKYVSRLPSLTMQVSSPRPDVWRTFCPSLISTSTDFQKARCAMKT